MGRPKPRETPAFGRFLLELRKETQGKRKSLDSVVQKLAGFLDGHVVSRTTLWKYENGRSPEAIVLWGLARLYGREPGALLERLAEEWCGLPLSAETKTASEAVILRGDELECWQGFRTLSHDEKAWILFALKKYGGASAGAQFRPALWDGVERRKAQGRQPR